MIVKIISGLDFMLQQGKWYFWAVGSGKWGGGRWEVGSGLWEVGRWAVGGCFVLTRTYKGSFEQQVISARRSRDANHLLFNIGPYE